MNGAQALFKALPAPAYVTKVTYRGRHRSVILRAMNHIWPLIGVLDDEPQFCTAPARLLKTHSFDVRHLYTRQRVPGGLRGTLAQLPAAGTAHAGSPLMTDN